MKSFTRNPHYPAQHLPCDMWRIKIASLFWQCARQMKERAPKSCEPLCMKLKPGRCSESEPRQLVSFPSDSLLSEIMSPTTPHLPILDPLILVFRFGRSAETTARQPLVLQSDLAAPLCWPPTHLVQRDQSTAWQHPGTNAHTHTTHRRALIQTNASYFTSVCRTAGSQRGNRMFLARFVASQRAGLKPKSGVKAQSRTENDAGFPSSRFI